MTLDQAVALSLLDDQLPKPGLTARLLAEDPELLELRGPSWSRRRAPFGFAPKRPGSTCCRGMIHDFQPFSARFPTVHPCCGTAGGSPCWMHRPWRSSDRAPRPRCRSIQPRGWRHDLAARGIVVVSGLARGVDSAAHRGALSAGQTIAVLGSGVDYIYPPEHAPLATQIAQAGVVLSEYPPGTAPLPHHFPMRNRLISGLSLAVVVIEASEKSGSLITARCALEQGREVMAVPGNVLSGRNRGGHALLKDGAKIVETADDIVEELGFDPTPKRPVDGGTSSSEAARSADPVLRVMEADHAYDLDALAFSSGLDVRRLLPRLIELELTGLVRRQGGGRFVRPSGTC